MCQGEGRENEFDLKVMKGEKIRPIEFPFGTKPRKD